MRGYNCSKCNRFISSKCYINVIDRECRQCMNRKCIDKTCEDCGAILKNKPNDNKKSRCKNCRKIFLKNKENNPHYGKKHSIYRRMKNIKKKYSNVDYNDFITCSNKKGKTITKFNIFCTQCGKSKGYLTTISAINLCKACRDKNHTFYTKEQKHIRSCMKANINGRLKSRLCNKNKKSTFDVIGYTIEQLMAHLESKFYPNPETGEMMTWENYGLHGWHIDHIIPDSLFNYSNIYDDDFKRCWSLDNLQPLWAKENLSKSNKILK